MDRLFRHLLPAGLVWLMLITTGCASVPVALSLATLTGGAIAYTNIAEESPIDPMASLIANKDCNAVRKGKDNGDYCREHGSGELAPVVDNREFWCYRTLGGLQCYKQAIPNREPVSFNAAGQDSESRPAPVLSYETGQTTLQQTPNIPSEFSFSPQASNNGLQTEAPVLVAPGAADLGITGQGLTPLPASAQPTGQDNTRIQPQGNEQTNIIPPVSTALSEYDGSGNQVQRVPELASQFTTQLPGEQGDQLPDNQPPAAENRQAVADGVLTDSSNIIPGFEQRTPAPADPETPETSLPNGNARDPLLRKREQEQDQINNLRRPQNAIPNRGSGGVVFNNEQYRIYNPEWIKPFPGSYGTGPQGSDNIQLSAPNTPGFILDSIPGYNRP